MAYLDDVFYWINLGHSFFEEVDPKRDIHVHRFAPKAESSHTALVLCDIRSQPTPIPLTPIRNLEALFGSDSVYVRWDPPSTVSHRGRGAWQNWSYHIQIGDVQRDISVAENDINTTEIKLNVLLLRNQHDLFDCGPAGPAGHGLRSNTLRSFSSRLV